MLELKDLLPALLKLSPALLGLGVLVYILTKMILKHFADEAKKREDFFIKEMEKKDAIIFQKDEQLEKLNNKLVAVTEKFIEVTEKNNQIISNLKEVIAAMKMNRE